MNTIVITAQIESRFVAEDDLIPFRCIPILSRATPRQTETSVDGATQSSSTILETANIGIKSPNTTLVSTDAATKISMKSRPKERKSLKERSRRQGIQSGYDTLASSRLFDMCPLLGLTCPTCTDTELQLPPNFCSLNFIGNYMSIQFHVR
ncbi:hypothetical protein TNCV_868371 [Trichonephila clavipes]|nr:hypothetical protein TNCV_868371 [Trichonephila clavipes]